MTLARDLADQLEALLSGTGDVDSGAQLVVTDPIGGEVAFHAALARHWRVDDETRNLLWVRPIVGGYPLPGRTGYAFSLNLARRRSLTYVTVGTNGDRLRFELTSGEIAHIGAAADAALDDLHRWDAWVYTALTADEEAALDALDADSWHGQWA